jgi:hypothetical protein
MPTRGGEESITMTLQEHDLGGRGRGFTVEANIQMGESGTR